MAQSFGWGIVEEGWRKGPWTAEEDRLLMGYVSMHGEGRWNSVATLAGLKRNGKSCRLRWVNYLRPDLKRGQITPHEERIIIELHARWGNRWSTIARSLPGRTDNEIKNYWRTHFKKGGTGKSSQRLEKEKNRILKQQQQQQQQQRRKQKQKQQVQQQDQPQQVDMKKVMSLLEEEVESDCRVSSAQGGAEMVFMYPQLMNEDRCLSNLVFDVDSSLPETHYLNIFDDGLWDDGLWNLDDVHGHYDRTHVTGNIGSALLHPGCF